MSYTRVNYGDVAPVADGMHFLRGPLGCEALGLTVVECPPGWTGKAHDHAGDDHEEVYVVVEGSVTLEVEGEPVGLSPGDAVRVDPGAARQVRNGDVESTLVIAGAP